jgi:flagellar biosynthesis protein FlhG
VIAFTGGVSVGKTNIAMNLAIGLSHCQRRVQFMDATINGGKGWGELGSQDSDYLIFDGPSLSILPFLPPTDAVIVVTTPEPVALASAYYDIKVLSGRENRGDIYVLLNQVTGSEEAEKFANVVAVTANKFLNTSVKKLGHVVTDPHVAQALPEGRSFLLEYPACPASECMRTVVEKILSM